LPRSPDVLVVCPANDNAATEITSALRGAGHVPVLIGDDFAQLPHLVRLLGPRAVVGVPGRAADADAALARTMALDGEPPRFVAWAAADAALEQRWTHHAHDTSSLLDALGDVTPSTQTDETGANELDLEVVAI